MFRESRGNGVKYRGKSRINYLLHKTLKQCTVTRWNGVLLTLKSVAENLTDLRALSIDPKANKNLMRVMTELNGTLLNAVIGVLDPFDAATKCLSADKQATIHLVLATKRRLVSHLTAVVGDCEVVVQTKQHLEFSWIATL